jgi:hypothetical protein
VDGVGDPDLIFTDEQRSDARLKGLFKEVLSELNLENLYDTKPSWTLDDHIPLINAGVPTLHIMDYSYGDRTTPGKYWHTKEDTVGKVSARSLSVTGEVILKLLDKIAKPQPK